MASLFKRFEDWSGRWKAIAFVVLAFAAFHGLFMVIVNLDADEPITLILLLSLLSTVVLAVKYVVLGAVSLPVYKNKRAIALSFGITLSLAAATDITMYVVEVFGLSNQLTVAYRSFTFQLTALLAIMMLVLYLVFNQDSK